MGKVILDMSVSLDGFVAGPNDEDGGLNDWFFAGGGANAAVIAELNETMGALVMGRRTYDVGVAHDGFANNPFSVEHVVLSRGVPETPAKGDTAFTFVSDGIERALAIAQEAAGEKAVIIGGGASIAQQYLNAGLVAEVHLHVVPVLLGEGKRLFDGVGPLRTALTCTGVIAGEGVNHLTYRVATKPHLGRRLTCILLG